MLFHEPVKARPVLRQFQCTRRLRGKRFQQGKKPRNIHHAVKERRVQLIFILQGTVYAKSIDNEHGYVLYETFDSPQVIEPYSLFGMFPQYTASYHAQTDISTVSFNKSYVLSELNKYEIFQLNYLNVISNRAQNVYRKLWDTHIGNTAEKITNFLQLRCTKPAGEKTLQIKMEDLATLIDDTRINVSKVLNKFQEEGLIQLKRKEIHIPALEKLIEQYT